MITQFIHTLSKPLKIDYRSIPKPPKLQTVTLKKDSGITPIIPRSIDNHHRRATKSKRNAITSTEQTDINSNEQAVTRRNIKSNTKQSCQSTETTARPTLRAARFVTARDNDASYTHHGVYGDLRINIRRDVPVGQWRKKRPVSAILRKRAGIKINER